MLPLRARNKRQRTMKALTFLHFERNFYTFGDVTEIRDALASDVCNGSS